MMRRSKIVEELAAARRALAEAEARCRDLEVEAAALRGATAGIETRLSLALADVGPKRRHLPDERASRTVKITVAGLDLYLTVGMYEDGSPGEIYVCGDGKWDPTVRAMLGQWAIAMSVALQWGADGRNLFAKFARQRFEPSGPASLDLGMASSPLDAIARWVLRTYYPEE